MENNELNLNEMESIAGGRGGSKAPLPPRENFGVYQIAKGDNLTKIAKRYYTTVDYLVSINPTITNKNDITAGYYMYVPGPLVG